MGLVVGSLNVRRCTWIDVEGIEAWKQFSDFDRLSRWFGIGHRLEAFEPGPMGHIVMSVELDAKRRQFGGKIVVWEPGRELSIEDNWHDEDMAWPLPTYISFKLTSYRGGTLVELFHHGFERLGAAAASEQEAYEAGWSNQHLVALRKLLDRRSA